jgi:ketosteroid isomerase-like protein
MKTKNQELIDKYLDIIKTDDYAHFGDLITDDCTFSLMPIGHTWKGRDDVMGFVMAAGSARKHDEQSHVRVTNQFTAGDYFCIEYEHDLIMSFLHYRTKIDGYCLVLHIRDGKFDQIREYINPSGFLMTFLTTYILRILPLAARLKARRRKR